MENNKQEMYFEIEIATQTNEYSRKHIEQLRQHQTKIGTQPMQKKSSL